MHLAKDVPFGIPDPVKHLLLIVKEHLLIAALQNVSMFRMTYNTNKNKHNIVCIYNNELIYCGGQVEVVSHNDQD